jgi:tRNA pseudouridine32 synthase / 23S rRNA pseudouridine746 synthase
MLLRTKVNPAVTRFTSSALPHGRAFLLKPITGKTHQLRVAMKSIGSPVAGDRRYAALADALLEDRTYLHCAAMRLVIQGENVQVICRPDQGKAFDENFMDVFDAWFSKGMERDTNLWFPDSKLLKSSLTNSEEYDSRS